jgi:hypothetical protein
VGRRVFAHALDKLKLMAAVLANILISGHDTPSLMLRSEKPITNPISIVAAHENCVLTGIKPADGVWLAAA